MFLLTSVISLINLIILIGKCFAYTSLSDYQTKAVRGEIIKILTLVLWFQIGNNKNLWGNINYSDIYPV